MFQFLAACGRLACRAGGWPSAWLPPSALTRMLTPPAPPCLDDEEAALLPSGCSGPPAPCRCLGDRRADRSRDASCCTSAAARAWKLGLRMALPAAARERGRLAPAAAAAAATAGWAAAAGGPASICWLLPPPLPAWPITGDGEGRPSRDALAKAAALGLGRPRRLALLLGEGCCRRAASAAVAGAAGAPNAAAASCTPAGLSPAAAGRSTDAAVAAGLLLGGEASAAAPAPPRSWPHGRLLLVAAALPGLLLLPAPLARRWPSMEAERAWEPLPSSLRSRLASGPSELLRWAPAPPAAAASGPLPLAAGPGPRPPLHVLLLLPSRLVAPASPRMEGSASASRASAGRQRSEWAAMAALTLRQAGGQAGGRRRAGVAAARHGAACLPPFPPRKGAPAPCLRRPPARHSRLQRLRLKGPAGLRRGARCVRRFVRLHAWWGALQRATGHAHRLALELLVGLRGAVLQ